jgi:hypothetical protein
MNSEFFDVDEFVSVMEQYEEETDFYAGLDFSKIEEDESED